MKKLLPLLALTLALAQSASAALCNVPGRQDATCLSAIANASTAQPSCPSGQLTVTPAQWAGSYWTSPVCKAPVIPPAPSSLVCAYGFAWGPSWNGSQWAYGCNPYPSCPDQLFSPYGSGPPLPGSTGITWVGNSGLSCGAGSPGGGNWLHFEHSTTITTGQQGQYAWNQNVYGLDIGMRFGISSGWVSVTQVTGGGAAGQPVAVSQNCAGGSCTVYLDVAPSCTYRSQFGPPDCSGGGSYPWLRYPY